MILYYVRHGDPIYHPDSLTELGHKQANALVKRFSVYGLDKIYASTSNRAKLTAKPTCDALGKEPVLLDWANEHYAWLEFTSKNEKGERRWLADDPKYKPMLNSTEVYNMGFEWYNHPYFAEFDCKNGTKRINDNTDAFLEELGFKHDREKRCYKVIKKNTDRVALFAHWGFGLLFLSSILDIPYAHFCTRFSLGHSSVTAIYFDENAEEVYPQILYMSNDSHLFKGDILTPYNNQLKV